MDLRCTEGKAFRNSKAPCRLTFGDGSQALKNCSACSGNLVHVVFASACGAFPRLTIEDLLLRHVAGQQPKGAAKQVGRARRWRRPAAIAYSEGSLLRAVESQLTWSSTATTGMRGLFRERSSRASRSKIAYGFL